VEIDITVAIREVERLYHGVTVFGDGSQPADMAGVQQINDKVLILDLFFRLTHGGLLTKMATNDKVASATVTINFIIRARYMKKS
jgi:hypothetical protein